MPRSRNIVVTVPSAPLFARLRQMGVTPSEFARKIHSTPQVLTNWKARGKIPLTALPAVADGLGLSMDDYIAEAHGRRAVRPKTLDASALLADYDALPDGLREIVARKAADLRRYVESLPAFLRNALARAPSDPEQYRAWEREVEAAAHALRSLQE